MARPVVLNDEEMLILPYTSFSPCVYKYNHADDSWSEWTRFPEDVESINHSAAVGAQHLFLFGKSGKVIQIDLETHTFSESPGSFHNGAHSALLHTDGELHIFGGWQDCSHWLWDEAEGSCTAKYSFQGRALPHHLFQSQLAWHCVHQMSNDKVLIVLHHAPKIFSYCMRSNECRVLGVTMPFTADFPCSVLTKDERFLILFGTRTAFGAEFISIHILDLKSMVLKRSRVRCPRECKLHAVLAHSKQKDERLVFGFIRQAWLLPGFEELQRLPRYMMSLIALWFSRETVHLFGDGLESIAPGSPVMQCRPHWSINVDAILKSL